MNDTTDNVVKLRSGNAAEQAINPKSLANMTDVEQEAWLRSIRDRRLKAIVAVRDAHEKKVRATVISGMVKIEKKTAQIDKVTEKIDKDMEKLEQLLFDLRALQLQYVEEDVRNATAG